MIRPSCTCEEKIFLRKEKRMLLTSHGVVDFISRSRVAWHENVTVCKCFKIQCIQVL